MLVRRTVTFRSWLGTENRDHSTSSHYFLCSLNDHADGRRRSERIEYVRSLWERISLLFADNEYGQMVGSIGDFDSVGRYDTIDPGRGRLLTKADYPIINIAQLSRLIMSSIAIAAPVWLPS